jgi:hypothetical protein
MQEPESGVIQAHAVIANDGRLLVILEFPDGQQRMLDRDAAVALGVTLLNVSSRLFPNAAEFSRTVDETRGMIQPLEPVPAVQ